MIPRAAAESADTAMEAVATVVKGITRTEFLSGLAVLVFGFIAVRVLLKLFRRTMDRAANVPESLRALLRTILRILLDLIVVMGAASVMQIPLSTFLAVFSVVGISISLGVQGMLSNFVGGVIILISRPFSVGDFVELDSFSGTVTDVGLMYTRLRAPGGHVNIIPNSTLVSSRVTNYSAAATRRVELTISASYQNAPAQVRAAVLSAVASLLQFLSDPAPAVNLERYDDSAIVYTVWAWVRASDFLAAKYALNEALYAAFAEAGVSVPFPQIVVHTAEPPETA